MTPLQVRLVQETFALVSPIAATAARLFYDRLFTLDPSLRPLFRGDIEEQGRKLMAALTLVTQGLSVPEKILPAVRALGQRHVSYGVRDEHYATVGAALLWTLEQGLGDHFTPQVRDAWAAAYSLLAAEMQDASAEATLPRQRTA
jgi:nitric oxide dioxygenase